MESSRQSYKRNCKTERITLINYDNIPEELKSLNQWVCAFKDSKCPMKAWVNETASSTDIKSWSDFKTAHNSFQNKLYDYCGFVFADNGFVGIDIDNGFDDGLINSLGADIIEKCRSYTEISRSGRGVHIILKGDLPFKGKNNMKDVEIYKASRYFIMTGNVIIYHDIIENQEAINYVLEKYFPETQRENKSGNRFKLYQPEWNNALKDGKVRLRPDYPPVTVGGRNNSLTSLAGALYNLGYNKMQIFKEISYANSVACKPPLNDNELQSICNSITRYRRNSK